jgi:hypothetical protein
MSTNSIAKYIFSIRAARAQYFFCNLLFFIYFASTITTTNADVSIFCCILFVANMFYHDSCCEPFLTFVSTRSLRTYYVTAFVVLFLKVLALFLLIFDIHRVHLHDNIHIILQSISIVSQLVFDGVLCIAKKSYLAEFFEDEFPFTIFTFDESLSVEREDDLL